ncbi:class A beta-lactamase Bla1 [Curtobacterium pusillum]|uniref:Beta-lactamase n=1 Tax=Curtobacterium pusillum TaxID=69373 RepID=A0ABX2MD61_9MICO|nr:class A beta-lactamase [Curtobacterium pusillum]NUU14840.1 class A beta-lactamase [Curtobacterium pusillum]GLK32401.1 beta-lactamase [Curtobacterium pusillum]
MRHSLPFLVAGGIALSLALAGCSGGSTSAGPSAGATARSSASPTPTPTPTISDADREAVTRSLAALEREYDATVGVTATDTTTGETVAYNGERRFGYASTLKVFAAAEFLRSVHGAARAERAHWTAADVAAAGHSPVTSEHESDGLTYAQLAEAAVRQSDNTALNLVLDRLSGPAALDDALARLGDRTTEVVHDEPDLNTIEPGSTEDTTTPAAFTASLARVLDGRTLDASDTALLERWMSGNATGDTLVRAGAPTGWTVADKSGGAGGIRNDIALVTRPDGGTIVISVLTTKNDPGAAYDDALVADAAAAVLTPFDTER